jgi:hypothetical protein
METDANDLEIIVLTALTIKEIKDIIKAAEMTDQKMLVQKISALSHDARMELMALMWIGRDFEGTYNEAVKYAHQHSDEGDVNYIAEKSPALPTYLKNGMKKIGF